MSYTLLQALEEVQSELDAVSTGCSAINAALAADKSSSADLLSESDKLQHELATSQKRSTLVHSFFKQYQLSAAEIAALQVLCDKWLTTSALECTTALSLNKPLPLLSKPIPVFIPCWPVIRMLHSYFGSSRIWEESQVFLL